MKLAMLVLGAIAVMLGGLWLLQGTGLVRIAPILCVADCAPLAGPSLFWSAIGLIVLAGGVAAVWTGIRQRG